MKQIQPSHSVPVLNVADRRIPNWRADLRRRIGGLFVLKLVALSILWTLFFSPAHRVPVTPDRVSHQLAATASAQAGSSGLSNEH